MMKRRWFVPTMFAIAGSVTVLSCQESSPSGASSESGLCSVLMSAGSMCEAPTSCTATLARDCGGLQGVFSPAYVALVEDCMTSLGDPQRCLDLAIERIPNDPGIEAFAESLCLACEPDNAACAGDVLSPTVASPRSRAGRLARTLDPETLAEVQTACVGMNGCGDAFDACAASVLTRWVPPESMGCFAESIAGTYVAMCESGVADGSAAEIGDTGDLGDSGSNEATAATSESDDGALSQGSAEAAAVDPTDTGGSTGSDAATDTSGETGLSSDETGDCLDGETEACAEPICDVDVDEPNDTEQQAAFLGAIGDDDDDGSQARGQLGGSEDIDWYFYEGSDDFLSTTDPFAQSNVRELEVCIYLECVAGIAITQIDCPQGTTPRTSPAGRPGCCAQNSEGFGFDPTCGSSSLNDDSSVVFMSVARGPAGVCQPYSLTYHF